jgi:hypothetical protein
LLNDRIVRLQIRRAGEILLERRVGWLTSGKNSLTIVIVLRMPPNIMIETSTNTRVGLLMKRRVSEKPPFLTGSCFASSTDGSLTA